MFMSVFSIISMDNYCLQLRKFPLGFLQKEDHSLHQEEAQVFLYILYTSGTHSIFCFLERRGLLEGESIKKGTSDIKVAMYFLLRVAMYIHASLAFVL